jgi:translation initiation factor IF-2
MIIAFNVRIEADAKRAAELQGVSIREYSVIYTLVEDIEQMSRACSSRATRRSHGHAEVRQAIKPTHGGWPYGHRRRNPPPRSRVQRAGQQPWMAALPVASLQDDVNEVREGFECASS